MRTVIIGSNFKRKLKINKFSYIKNINDLPMTKKHLKQSQEKDKLRKIFANYTSEKYSAYKGP